MKELEIDHFEKDSTSQPEYSYENIAKSHDGRKLPKGPVLPIPRQDPTLGRGVVLGNRRLFTAAGGAEGGIG